MNDNAVNFFNQFVNESKQYEQSLTYLYKRTTGSFYTGFELAYKMVCEMYNNIEKDRICSMKILEPCNGTGIFIFAILKYFIEKKYSTDDIQKVVNNIYISEVNDEANNFYKKHLKRFCSKILNYKISDKYFNEHIFGYLSYDITNLNQPYKSIKDYTDIKFDIVITNPPYKNLKLDSKEYNKDLSKKYKDYYSEISKDAKNRFLYSSSGVINVYKIFIEEILCNSY